jgi:hypothetical protein
MRTGGEPPRRDGGRRRRVGTTHSGTGGVVVGSGYPSRAASQVLESVARENGRQFHGVRVAPTLVQPGVTPTRLSRRRP